MRYLFLLSLLFAPLLAGEAAPDEYGKRLEQARSALAVAESAGDLDDANRAKIIEVLKQTTTTLERGQAAVTLRQKSTEAVQGAPEKIRDLREKPLTELGTNATQSFEEAPLATLEGRVKEWSVELSAWRQELQQLEAQIAKLREDPTPLRKAIAEATTRRDEALKATPGAGDPRLVAARTLAVEAERLAASDQLAALELELASIETRASLRNAERERLLRLLPAAEERIRSAQEIIARLRQGKAEEIRRETEETQAQMGHLPEAMQRLAQENLALSQELERITRADGALATHLQELEASLKALEEDYKRVEGRVRSAGVSEALGVYLWKQRVSLTRWSRSATPDTLALPSPNAAVNALNDLDERQRQHPLLAQELRQALGADATRRLELEKALARRAELLELLQANYTRILRSSADREAALVRLAVVRAAYIDLIDQHVLQIRSAAPFSPEHLLRLADGLTWFASTARWRSVLRDAAVALREERLLLLAGLGATIFLLLLRPRLLRSLTRERSGRREQPGALLSDIASTALLALTPMPLLGAVGLALAASAAEESLADALGQALILILYPTFLFAFYFQALRPAGLAIQQGGGDPEISARFRVTFFRYGLTLLLLTHLLYVTQVFAEDLALKTVGRAIQLAILALAALFVWGNLQRRCAIWNEPYLPLPTTTNGRRTLVGVLLLLLLTLGGFTSLGFHYATLLLVATGMQLLGALTLLLFLRAILTRFLHRTYLEQKREARARAAKASQVQAGEESIGVNLIAALMPEDEEVAFTLARRFLRMAMLAIFLAVLANLGEQVTPVGDWLRGVVLWQSEPPTHLGHALVALFWGWIVIAGTNNLPGMLILTLFHWHPLDRGAKMALVMLIRYILLGLGLYLITAQVGIDWGQLQWLIAALGVGLGFGLQEIVANFISGIILLFERPIRIGDAVTVGDVSGLVTRIHIRATTITDWSRRELIVPNKEFITGRLINWSLSDPITRLTIPVGIAYGSDTHRAEAILLEVARSCASILEIPPPSALFLGFGDNSLNFELRVFVGRLEDRLPVQHLLHMEIDRRFREAGITIAFPQRDVHLDAKDPIPVPVVKP